jgi:hypothetical protein
VSLWLRWLAAASAALITFVLFWAVLHFAVDVPTADALGWAAAPFTVVLAVAGVWADQPRRQGEDAQNSPGERTHTGNSNITQKQRATKNARQIQVGGDMKVVKRDE